MDNPIISLLNWVVGASTPLLAGFIGGVISQAVVMLATRGESQVPRSVRVQIVLVWMAILGLLLINVNQGRNIASLLSGGN